MLRKGGGKKDGQGCADFESGLMLVWNRLWELQLRKDKIMVKEREKKGLDFISSVWKGQIKAGLISSHTDNYFISRTPLFDREANRWTAQNKSSFSSSFKKISKPRVIITKLA